MSGDRSRQRRVYLLALRPNDLLDARYRETSGVCKLLGGEQPSAVEAADLRVEPFTETLEFLTVSPVRFACVSIVSSASSFWRMAFPSRRALAPPSASPLRFVSITSDRIADYPYLD
jgi:hypothetical protein